MSTLNRIQKGFTLYRRGNVDLIFQDENEIQFNVKSGKTEYLVSINEDGIKCNVCEDWHYRWKHAAKVGGSFLCSHCYAALFKLSQLREIGTQGTLGSIVEEALQVGK